jgi:SAM-dependent MidA family methyltransferase
MAGSTSAILLERIRARGPMTVAEFMELALYHPEHGYYASSARRSGRAGDFFTSVDVGPVFGDMIAVELADMWELLSPGEPQAIDLVEAGAGDGRLMRDILDALTRDVPELYARLRVTLVESSAVARRAQPGTLEGHRRCLISSGDELPRPVTGVIMANELLDALPVHVIQFGEHDVDEIYVTEREGILVETTGPVSDDRIRDYVAQSGVSPRAGVRAEVGLAATDWISDAAAALDKGFLLLFDYAREAAELYSGVHPGGTLAAYRRHMLDSSRWLDHPGHSDLTAHVNLTAVRAAAAASGLTALGALDQTYFLLNLGLVDRLSSDQTVAALRQRIAAQALLMPGGLGSTMKVLAFGKGVDGRLRGFSAGRLT